MSAFLDFSAQPHWDPQALAGAVPIRLKLHQLFAFDARSETLIPDGAGQDGKSHATEPRRAWRQHEYLRVADLPVRFSIR
jgi:hypothetical protein